VPILIDTNILVRTVDRDDPQYGLCLQALQIVMRSDDDPVICAQVLIEFWSVVTRPRAVNGMGLSASQAERYIEQTLRSFPCVIEPPDMADHWRDVVVRYDVTGKQAHDARLIALMNAHGINRLMTLNTAHFARYHEVESVSPSDVIRSSAP
jgi:predicted nucleic acid-binding protein